MFGLGEADDPDVLKRNLLIHDNPNHEHDLTKGDRRSLCDSARLSYEELQNLMKSVRHSTNRERKNLLGGGHWANGIFLYQEISYEVRKNVHIIIGKQSFDISKEIFFKPNLHKIGWR